MLGHSSVQLTLDTYTHLVPDLKLKERAAARLDALLRERKRQTPVKTPVKPGKKW